MPPAWVDFCWVLVREKCDDVKWISVVIIGRSSTGAGRRTQIKKGDCTPAAEKVNRDEKSKRHR
jgi:hypothetical protein